MSTESKERVYDMLAKVFMREGVTTCFALLGDANMNWAARLAEQGCKMVYVRHEHCAAAAAMAYARKTGEIGVATVTCGPGLTQLMTALPAAVRAHLPLVVFAGESPIRAAWYNQELDQAPFVLATGAAYHSLHHIDRMAAGVRDAFLQARLERRPVVVGIPYDLQNRPWEGPAELPAPSRELVPRIAPLAPSAADVAAAAAMVGRAERVVVLAGLGAVEADAGPACRALAAKVGGLLATTLPARGLFHEDPYCIGISGSFTPEAGLALLAEADCVIAVGSSLNYYAGGGGQLWPKAKTLHIDVQPVALNNGQVVSQQQMRADARLGVEALAAALPARSGLWRSDAIATRIRTSKPDSHVFEIEPGLLDPRDVAAALEANLPYDWEMVNSSGHCSWFFAQMPSRPQTRFLAIREFGAIGNGLSFAMGVAAAHPERTVVLFDGDGGLLMNIQELETIKRHGMNILIAIMNDGAYGSEVHKFRSAGLPEAGSVFGYPDLAGIARGFGLAGHTFKSLDDLPKRVAEFARTGGAAVWDFHVSDKVASPTMRRAHPTKAKA